MQADADKGKLSPWERWELASFDESERARAKDSEAADSEVKLPSAEEVEAIRLAAHAEGLQQGRQEGYAAGRAEALADGRRLAELGSALDEALAKLDQQIAEDLLGLALEVARQVVRQAIAVKPELVLGVLREALAQMPQVHAMIHMHPDDASLTRSYLGDQLAHAGHRIVEDPRLSRGDCIIESGSSQLDASVATRWKRVAENLGMLGIDADWPDSDRSA